MAYGVSKLGEIYDRIEAEQGRPMSESDGFQWGLDYLKDVIKRLEKLELDALQKNNPLFYSNIKLSVQKAREVQAELDQKLGSLKKL
jgi:hypothetical protein